MTEEQLKVLVAFCTERAEMARRDEGEMLALTQGSPNVNFGLAQGRGEAFRTVLQKIKEITAWKWAKDTPAQSSFL